jgi:RES domain-containing protein
MKIYRIVKSAKRARDLSGTGAYKGGGRWNSAGTYMLYASENSSLAYLENLVHFEQQFAPPSLCVVTLEMPPDKKLVMELAEEDYPQNWLEISNLDNKKMGDRWMKECRYLAVKVRSAINTKEYNYLLNPLFPGFHDLVRIAAVEELAVDVRLVR